MRYDEIVLVSGALYRDRLLALCLRQGAADHYAIAISVPAFEARVLKHFQARMPYGLVVPDVDDEAAN